MHTCFGEIEFENLKLSSFELTRENILCDETDETKNLQEQNPDLSGLSENPPRD